jgi:ribosome-binding protein aMBF1 (putative translation factor)
MPTSNGRYNGKKRSPKTRRDTRTPRTTKAPKTTNALKILDRITGNDAELRELIQQERVNVHVARLIHETRTKAGLTQEQLAERIGTKQPVIARLEDADYDGHSLTMLQRIAEALNFALDIRLVPKRRATA